MQGTNVRASLSPGDDRIRQRSLKDMGLRSRRRVYAPLSLIHKITANAETRLANAFAREEAFASTPALAYA